MDCVVMKLLNPVCTQLRREREKEIRRLAVHDEQFHNELTSYENSLALNPVCTQLRREREKEIRRLAVHDEQFHNELTSYENSLAAVQLMLKKNDGYKGLYLYQWMREAVKRILDVK